MSKSVEELEHIEQAQPRDLLAEMRAIKRRIDEQLQDLTDEEREALADELSREIKIRLNATRRGGSRS